MFKLKKERVNQKKIDSGASGAVFPYQKDANDLKWVVKRIHADDADEVLSSFPEIVLGFSCDHPCIVPLKGYSIQKGSEGDYYVYLKFPRMKESLKKRFDDQQRTKIPFSEQEIVQYFYSLVSAVDYLHTKKIYHRDIKPANILLDHNGDAKLSDIGVAKYVGDEEIYQQLTGQGGTVDYTAPEFYRDKEKLTKESLRENDIWSIGLVMLELCALERRLFNPLTAREKILEIQEKLEKKLKEIYAEKLIALILQLLKVDPNERIKIEKVKKTLEKEYSYCRSLEICSEKEEEGQSAMKEIHALNESLKKLQEKYKNALQGIMAEVGALKQENLQLKNELKQYQYFLRNYQPHILTKISQYSYRASQKIKAKHQALAREIAHKNKQDLKEKAQIPPKYEISLRSYVVGLGKTAFCTRLIDDIFLEKDSSKCRNLSQKLITQDGKTFEISLWKLGFDRYEEVVIRSHEVLIALYDITNYDSFRNLESEIEFISLESERAPIIFLLGTKLDLESQRKVTKIQAEKYAKELGAFHFEVSSKTGKNIMKFQEKLTRALLARDWPSEKTTVIGKDSGANNVEKKVEQKKSSFWGLF